MMDSRKFKKRIQRRLCHACASDCESDTDTEGLSTSSLPLTETCMEYFQDSFPGSEGLGRLDMPMAATVTKRNQVSPCSVVLSMMYAKRLRQQNKQYLQSMSSTDVFFISMMMASKYLYDEGVDEEVYNDEWAASVGHDTDDVNKMEMDFLKEMDWHLFAKPEDFDNALTAVERRLALREGVRRGWFTYTEMSVLLDWDPVYNLWNQVGVDCTKMVSLMSAVYVASLVSVMGSAAIAIQLSGPMASATVATVLSLQASILSVRHTLTSPMVSVQHFPCNSSSMETIVDSENVDNVVGPAEVSLEQDEFLAGIQSRENSSHLDNGAEEPLWLENAPGRRQDCGDDARDAGKHCEEGLGKSASQLKRKLKPTSSVLSLWLFDSLISQVLSVFETASTTTTPTTTTATTTTTTDHVVNGDNHHPNCLQNNERDQRKGVVCNKCEKCRNMERSKCLCNEGNRSSKLKSCRSQPFRPTIARISTSTNSDNVNDNGMSVYKSSPGWRKNPSAVKGCENQQSLLAKHPVVHTCPNSCECISLDCDNHGTDTANLNLDRGVGGSNSLSTLDHLPPTPSHEVIDESNLDLILPLSLMTEVPILDPVGFFTKNSSPASYILST